MLQGVLDRAPGIYKFCHLSYSQPSVLVYDRYTILSQEGPQQGDPLTTSLFRNTIQPLLQASRYKVRVPQHAPPPPRPRPLGHAPRRPAALEGGLLGPAP